MGTLPLTKGCKIFKKESRTLPKGSFKNIIYKKKKQPCEIFKKTKKPHNTSSNQNQFKFPQNWT
jgi:hypothetical protein